MKYKFTTKVFGQEGIYGIEYESIDENEKGLFQINSHEWKSEEVLNILNKTNSLRNNDQFQYQVAGGHLGLIIDKEFVSFFDLIARKQETEDFRWPKQKFIDFLEAFMKFLKENGR